MIPGREGVPHGLSLQRPEGAGLWGYCWVGSPSGFEGYTHPLPESTATSLMVKARGTGARPAGPGGPNTTQLAPRRPFLCVMHPTSWAPESPPHPRPAAHAGRLVRPLCPRVASWQARGLPNKAKTGAPGEHPSGDKGSPPPHSPKARVSCWVCPMRWPLLGVRCGWGQGSRLPLNKYSQASAAG